MVLAELLAFDFQSSSFGGIPNLKADLRWDDHKAAVLSTCSSLITIFRDGDSQVVQFSHFLVKEYPRPSTCTVTWKCLAVLYRSRASTHDHGPACLGTLLRLDGRCQ